MPTPRNYAVLLHVLLVVLLTKYYEVHSMISTAAAAAGVARARSVEGGYSS